MMIYKFLGIVQLSFCSTQPYFFNNTDTMHLTLQTQRQEVKSSLIALDLLADTNICSFNALKPEKC